MCLLSLGELDEGGESAEFAAMNAKIALFPLLARRNSLNVGLGQAPARKEPSLTDRVLSSTTSAAHIVGYPRPSIDSPGITSRPHHWLQAAGLQRQRATTAGR